MSPDEIRACYRLHAAHRKSREICAFPGTVPLMDNAGDRDDLAVLLSLHIGLERLGRDIGHCDPKDDLCRTVAGVNLRKMLASLAAQLFGRGALAGR